LVGVVSSLAGGVGGAVALAGTNAVNIASSAGMAPKTVRATPAVVGPMDPAGPAIAVGSGGLDSLIHKTETMDLLMVDGYFSTLALITSEPGACL
jgi:hypothetical protein